MIALVKILRSNKQVIELFCLIVSLPLIILNVELNLSELYPKHLSVATADQQWEGRNGLGLNVTEFEDEEDQFSNAFNKIMRENLEKRSQVVSDVCR